MTTGNEIAYTAINSGLIGTPYKELDCQAFVEKVLQLAGLKIPNYRGSNHMWRELVYDRTPIVNPKSPVPGSLVFKVKFDGGETKRGYHDKSGNAVHVGIALGDGKVLHSTTGGVQYGTTNTFTDWALIKDVDYTDEPAGGEIHGSDEGAGPTLAKVLLQYVQILRDTIDDLEARIHELE